MTGIFVRITRNNAIVSVELEQLTDAELEEFVADKDVALLSKWVIKLAAWVRDNVHAEEPVRYKAKAKGGA